MLSELRALIAENRFAEAAKLARDESSRLHKMSVAYEDMADSLDTVSDSVDNLTVQREEFEGAMAQLTTEKDT